MNKQTPTKRLFLLISIFLLGIFSLIILNMSITTIITKLDNKSKNLKAKIQIAKFIVDDLYKIRSDFYELTVTASNEKARRVIKFKIKEKIEFINDALNVLDNGGSLKRVIDLNLVGHSTTTKHVTLNKEKREVSLETIELKPKLLQINKMIKELDKLLLKRSLYKISKNFDDYLKNEGEINRFYKNTPTFFIRIIENASRSLYEENVQLEKLQETISKDKNTYHRIELLLIIFIVGTVLYLGFKIAKQINSTSLKILKQEIFTRGILDAQSNIVVVSDGDKMIDANKALVDFFEDFYSFKDFQRKHACICDFFEKVDMKDFLTDREINGIKWYQYLLDNPRTDYKVAMKAHNELRFFKLKAVKTTFDNENSIIIISLYDITTEFKAEKELKLLNDNLENLVEEKVKELKLLNDGLENKIHEEIEKNREKEKALMLQARYASMGEMIGNIAHQWRQPLSAISSTASATNLELELKISSEKEVKQSLEKIMSYVNFLNKTIEDFRNFFMEDREKIDFDITDILNNTISLIEASYTSNEIEIIQNSNKKCSLVKGFPTELSQVFLNLLNNAKDAYVKKQLPKKFVFVNIKEKTNFIEIEFLDNALGINEKYIEKIFDPYFTTKHKSQGTGIGLYMTKEIIEKHMNGTIEVSNKYFSYKDNDYIGASFIITLPKTS